ncbi:UNVERIFIED_CONTAM: hypothetical protein HDU68_011885 [Siphonaria sp. JEL0065]|nr:hypothetical protein HDU68_011885 [Siphonaria sp. JEL0065]
MEAFTQICLTCEKKLQHDGIYCSMVCLRKDFGIIPSETPKSRDGLGWINARNSLHRTANYIAAKSSPYLPSSSLSEQALECPPSPTLSATSDTSSVYSRNAHIFTGVQISQQKEILKFAML